MSSTVDALMRFITLASIILAFLLYYLLKQRNALAKLFLLYFFICLSFILVKWHLHIGLGTYDAGLYQSVADTISSQLHQDFIGNLLQIFHAYSAYTVPLGLLYFIFGPSELIGQLFSTVIGLGVLYNVHRLALVCLNRRTANLSALFLALYPYGWVLASTLNRDMPIAFFITLLFRTLAETLHDCQEAIGKSRYAIILMSLVSLTLLRPPLLLLGGLTIAVYLLVQKRVVSGSANLFQPLKTFLIAAMILAAATTLFWAKDRLVSLPLARQVLQFVSIDQLNLRLESSEDANSAYLPGLRYRSARDIPVIMPVATLYFMYSPLPWQVRSPKQALGLIDSTLLLFLTYYFLKGIKTLYRRRRKFSLVLLTFLIVGFCTSSLLQSNVGAAMRHRTMFFIMMVPVTAHACRRVPGCEPVDHALSSVSLPIYPQKSRETL